MYTFRHILQYSVWKSRKQLCTIIIMKWLQIASIRQLLGLLWRTGKCCLATASTFRRKGTWFRALIYTQYKPSGNPLVVSLTDRF